MTATRTASATYTQADVGKVMRRVGADLSMIADSTGAWMPAETANYVHDVEELANRGYLDHVDVTLLSGGVEIKAARFVIDENASGLANQRPGDALWPRLPNPTLRIVLSYDRSYGATARESMRSTLKVNWVPSRHDTSHSTLSRGASRSYASNAFGMRRLDWAA